MRNKEIEKEMYRLAVELIEKRYPDGWGGAGVVHTSAGHFYTSVSNDTANGVITYKRLLMMFIG